ncbi:MAG: sigma-54-dependent Fis family transcriptional regulator [Deltaproteobacteria bacterium]|nr:sigma-54-dependent Fis family transcriptional regulator [Deltaproteobacteria bacterium]
MSERKPVVLVADDDEGVRELLATALEGEYRVFRAKDGKEAQGVLQTQAVEVAFLDIHMPGKNAFELLAEILGAGGKTEPIVITALQDMTQLAFKAGQLGATDFLSKDFDNVNAFLEEVLLKAKLALDRKRRREEIEAETKEHAPFDDSFFMESVKMKDVARAIEHIARFPVTVLILGDSGTGKDVCARRIHQQSPRAKMPFVPFNVASLAADLMENELFGHEKGAFTGAHSVHRGYFERAHGGTLFIDEIGELPIRLQAKLLRVLQEKEIVRVGSTEPLKVDVRLIFATNADLEKKVAAGELRSDLYYRIKVATISLPPLKDRPEDIPFLIDFFWSKYCHEFSLSTQLGGEARAAMNGYLWPGNIRELENLVQHLVISYPGEVIGVDHLPPQLKNATNVDVDREALLGLLKRFAFNVKEAAASEQIPLSTLYYRIKKSGLSDMIRRERRQGDFGIG